MVYVFEVLFPVFRLSVVDTSGDLCVEFLCSLGGLLVLFRELS